MVIRGAVCGAHLQAVLGGWLAHPMSHERASGLVLAL